MLRTPFLWPPQDQPRGLALPTRSMGSVGVARPLDQPSHAEGPAPTHQKHVSSKRRRPPPHEELVQPRCPPPSRRRRQQQRPAAEQVPPPPWEDTEEEEEEEMEDGDEDSDYREDESDSQEEEEKPTPATKHQRQARSQQRHVAAGAAGGVSSLSASGGGGAGVGWGGGREVGDHECLVCGKVFAKACKLARHAATHTGEKPYVCGEDGCSKAFATKDKLKRHALSHARRKVGLSASVGNAARREAETRQNAAVFAAKVAAAGVSLELPPGAAAGMMTATATAPLLEASRMEREGALGGGSGSGTGGGWKHSCPTCGRNFLDNYHLKRHVKAIHEGPRPYKCEHPVVVDPAAAGAETSEGAVRAGSSPAASANGGACSPSPPAAAAASNTAMADAAVVAADAESNREELGTAGPLEEERVSSRDGGDAGRTQDRNTAQQEHDGPGGEGATVQKGNAGGLWEEAAAGEKEQRHARVFGVCGAAFAKKWQLREHLFAAHGQTKFNSRQHQCSHAGCGRVFDRPSKLAAHMKTHKARFVCEFEGCGAAFVLASGLNLHLKEEHPFRCGVCDKLFDREDKMQIHQGTHNRAGDGDFIRPYHCNVRGCGKSFTEKRNLNAHRRTRHTEGGRKRFRCEVGGCAMAFAHRHTLNKHIKREHENAPSTTGNRSKTIKSKNNKNSGCPAGGDTQADPTVTATRFEEDPELVPTPGAAPITAPRDGIDAPQARKPDVKENPLAEKESATYERPSEASYM